MPKHQYLKLCDARLPRKEGRLRRAAAAGPEALEHYLRRSGQRCRNRPVAGKQRCRHHGGLSCGPISTDGKARAAAAGVAGRAQWLRRLRDAGEPIPCGRKRGGKNRSLEEREQAAAEKRRRRQAHLIARTIRLERRHARRAAS